MRAKYTKIFVRGAGRASTKYLGFVPAALVLMLVPLHRDFDCLIKSRRGIEDEE
jgi:hypothetical protein